MSALKRKKEEENLILYENFLDKTEAEDIAGKKVKVPGKAMDIGVIVCALLLIVGSAVFLNEDLRSRVLGENKVIEEVLNEDRISNSNSTSNTKMLYDKEALKGEKGEPGKNGKNGINGVNGKNGVNGLDGNDGLNGVNGTDGKNGLNGSNGTDGKDGLNGVSGTDGKDGVSGLAGKNGKDGLNGVNGKDGLNGLDGKDGKSTYELALAAGYTGTEEALASTLSEAEQKFLMLDSNMVGMKTEIDQNIDTLNNNLANTKTELQQGLNQCFQSVSDGKKLLASALLTKGVHTQEDANFEQLKADILNIPQTITVNNIPGSIEYIYHNHAGASSVQGGCYTKPIAHTHTSACVCPGIAKHTGICQTIPARPGWKNHGYKCTTCGGEYSYESSAPCGDQQDQKCQSITRCTKPSGIEGYNPSCGYVEGQIVEAKIKFN